MLTSLLMLTYPLIFDVDLPPNVDVAAPLNVDVPLYVPGMATHVFLHQQDHRKVQADRKREEGLGAVPPRDHRVDEIRLIQRK